MYSGIRGRPFSKGDNHMIRPPTRKINSQQAQKCFQKAKQHQSRHEFQMAIKHYTETILNDPYHYKAYCNVGTIYRQLNQYSEAIASYRKALKINPDDYKSKYNLANLYRLENDIQDAIFLYKSILQSKNIPKELQLDTLNNLGLCYKIALDYEQAIKIFEQVIAKDQNFQGGYINYASCLILLISKTNKKYQLTIQQRKNMAQKMFKKVLQVNPSSELAKYNLIYLKHMTTESRQVFQQCMDQYKQILSRLETDKKPYEGLIQKIQMNVIQCQHGLKKLQSNVENVHNTISSKKIVNAPQNQSQIVGREIDQNIEPVKNENQYKQQQSDSKEGEAQIINEYGLTQQELKEQKLLIARIPNMMEAKVSPDSVRVRLIELRWAPLSRVYYQQMILLLGKLTQDFGAKYAPQCYQAYLDLKKFKNTEKQKPSLFECALQFHKILAECLTILKQFQKASQHYALVSNYLKQHADEDRIIDVTFETSQAINYEERGLIKQAIQCYQRSLLTQPKNFNILSSLADCYQQAKNFSKALQKYRQCIQSVLDAKQNWIIIADSYLNSSICYDNIGNKEEQRKCLQKAMQIFDTQCETFDDISRHYDSQLLLRAYLKLCSFYEEDLQKSQQQFKQQIDPNQQSTTHKLIAIYLILLSFENCPDRQEVIINLANLFYLQKRYLNALNYYKLLPLNISSNYRGITYLQINEYVSAYDYIINSIKNQRDNKVYWINFGLLDWIFGEADQQQSFKSKLSAQIKKLEEQPNNQRQQVKIQAFSAQYSCDCDSMFYFRLAFGFEFIQQLTDILSHSPQIVSQAGLQNINKDIKLILNKMKQRSSSDNNWHTNLIKFVIRQLDRHCRDCHQKNNKQQVKQQLDDEIFELAMTDNRNIKDHTSKLFDILNELALKDNPLIKSSYSIIVTGICSLFMLTNSPSLEQFKQLVSQNYLEKKDYSSIKSSFQILFQTVKTIQNKYRHLNLQDVIEGLKEWVLQLQQHYSILISKIKETYYSLGIDQIKNPMQIQYNFPQCADVRSCDQCCFKIGQILCASDRFKQTYRKHFWFSKQEWYTDRIRESVFKIIESCGQSKFEIKLSQNFTPVTIDCYFASEQDVKIFLQKLSSNLKTDSILLLGACSINIDNVINMNCRIGNKRPLQQFLQRVVKSTMGHKTVAALSISSLNLKPFLELVSQDSQKKLEDWKKIRN